MTTALALLTPQEEAHFFPGDSRDRLQTLLPDLKVVDPTTLDDQAWRDLLAREQPRLLLACWKTPALPDDVMALTDGNLDYVCYLAGSVRKLISGELLASSGLKVTNWGNAIARTVAETALLLTLSTMRRAGSWQLAMHLDGAWKTSATETRSLFERKVGLHGFGVISRELVKLMQPFGATLSTYSPSVPDSLLQEYGVHRAECLEDLFAQNDIIVELAALTPKNRHIVTEELLRAIPEGGSFVNVGRGAVVDEEALVRVAKEGKLQVALDVYEKEPLPVDHPFRGLRNVFLLPHLGGPSTDRRQDSGRLALENIAAWQQGDDLDALITTDVYARAT